MGEQSSAEKREEEEEGKNNVYHGVKLGQVWKDDETAK